ncbi:metalloendopeptidase [Clostridia bacterium]|nr:metalloendopeptidase [Clostridia bacterium]
MWAKAGLKSSLRAAWAPVPAAAAKASSALAPARYKLWRFACAALFYGKVAAERAGFAAERVRSAALGVRQSVVPRALGRVHAISLIAILSIVVFVYGFYGMGLEVSIDGVSQGYVRSESQFEEALAQVSARASELLDAPYVMNPDVTYHFSLVSRGEVFNSKEVADMLFSRIPELKYMYVLTLDGEQYAGSANREAIEDALASRLALYSDYESANFLKTAEVTWQLAPVTMELSGDELGALAGSELRPATYVTAHDSSLPSAAKSAGMSADALRALNPGLDETNILGARLLVNYATPLLQVKATKTLIYDETVPFDTQYVDDPDQYKGRSKVITEGSDGAVRVTASAIYLDGRETARSIIDTQTTTEMVTKVVAVGTQEPPTFIRPYYGPLTSGFKMRALFGVRKMHTGVDFSGPTGAPIAASCGGKVIFAGSKGSYGLAVIIDHGHGITTLYAHNSKLLVKVGQTVKQGEQIARLGSTGRSTGPHCHFEVRINDKPVNPMLYLK